MNDLQLQHADSLREFLERKAKEKVLVDDNYYYQELLHLLNLSVACAKADGDDEEWLEELTEFLA